ncbi:MAG: hypothetical protein IKQ32_00645 [Prevotella sp.]|nr:hypothetical protein [Prevotella sp.]
MNCYARHVTDGTDGPCQMVEVMEALVVAVEGGHVLRPGCKDEQRAVGARTTMVTSYVPGTA